MTLTIELNLPSKVLLYFKQKFEVIESQPIVAFEPSPAPL